ncbi:MAG TPA: NAD(P)/FAD-dependent oxidoreductase [Terriglobales bacterium]|jgi:flavin-dependent dehydrogenase|nr:NAD(P)/FAD-dependent oxidoreductase [Terriglobales bacterium]
MVDSPHRRNTDVFIIGGGPAGLAAAIAARQRGFEVVVADSAIPPIDKPCGEGLMPDGISALADLGIIIPPEESYPFRGIRFVSSGAKVDASFPTGQGLGIRRTKLHSLMIDRAVAAGVNLLWQTVVTGLHPDGVWLGANLVRSRWIVGADGAHSRVRNWAGLDENTGRQQRFAFRRHYRISPWTSCMELHWGDNCQLYITPIAGNEICVAAISRDPHLRLDAALAKFPAVGHRLEGLEVTSVEKGAVSATQKLRHVYRGRTALIGDASGSVDAITGEGLCLAFRQAILLSESFATGTLDAYQARHRSLARRPALMSWLMLTLDGRDWYRQRVMRAFASQPQTFARMLALHVGAITPMALARIGLSLGWNLLIL